MFIELNMTDNRRVLINTSLITSMYRRQDGATVIHTADGEVIYVKESYDEVKEMINALHTRKNITITTADSKEVKLPPPRVETILY